MCGRSQRWMPTATLRVTSTTSCTRSGAASSAASHATVRPGPRCLRQPARPGAGRSRSLPAQPTVRAVRLAASLESARARMMAGDAAACVAVCEAMQAYTYVELVQQFGVDALAQLSRAGR